MGIVITFPGDRRGHRNTRCSDAQGPPAVIVVLPNVRIERFIDGSANGRFDDDRRGASAQVRKRESE
jgi:hypothetical protein